MRPVLVGVGALVACIVAGAILLGLGRIVIGTIVMVCGIPVGMVAWVTSGERL